MKIGVISGGAGGLALGLWQAEHEIAFVCTHSQVTKGTIALNRKDWFCVDDSKIHQVPDYDCLAISFLSMRSFSSRFEIFRSLIAKKHPAFFLCDLPASGVQKFDYFESVFKKFGYKVHRPRMLSTERFSVPQVRKRALLIGYTHDNLQFIWPKQNPHIVTVREALQNVPKSIGVFYDMYRYRVLALVPEGGNWRDLPKDVQESFMPRNKKDIVKTGFAKRLSWDKPAPILPERPAIKGCDRCHPEETRPLTVREYARLQTFPDSWKFSGDMYEQYAAIALSVPVKYAKAIGIALLAMEKSL